ncbi:MAG: RluA family pseudouridine synthase [Candidatus Scatovivens sp.]
MELYYKVIDYKYNNVKDILKNYFHMSDRLISKLKRENKIYLNNQSIYVTNKVSFNDILKVDLNFEEESDNIVPIKMNLNILYEDDWLLIVDKPPFTPVHPSCNYYNTSLANGVKYYYLSKKLNLKIRPVNRLDKDTSGIVIFAKNQYIQESLIQQMKANKFIKEYTAILNGILKKNEFTINAPISRKEDSIIEREVNLNGDTAITHFKVIKKLGNYTVVKCLLETGRTHQIRVHCNYIGYPILGDSLYGEKSNLINRQALHSNKVEFIHPITNKKVIIKSEIPLDMKRIIV